MILWKHIKDKKDKKPGLNKRNTLPWYVSIIR